MEESKEESQQEKSLVGSQLISFKKLIFCISFYSRLNQPRMSRRLAGRCLEVIFASDPLIGIEDTSKGSYGAYLTMWLFYDFTYEASIFELYKPVWCDRL